MTGTHAFSTSVHIEAADAVAQFHCAQTGDRYSLSLSDGPYSDSLFLTGTSEEIREFANKLLDAVTRREATEDAAHAV